MAKEVPQDPQPIVIEGDPAAPAPASGQSAEALKAAAQAEQQSMLNVMRDKYAAEPRVRVKVHNDGPVQVQVNGYSFLIREGVPVMVPESVAEILEDAGYI